MQFENKVCRCIYGRFIFLSFFLRVGGQHRSRNRTWSDCGLCVLRFSWLRSYRLCLAQWRAKGETAEQRCSGGVVVHHLKEAG